MIASQHEEWAPAAPPRRRPVADDAHQGVGHHVVQLGDQQQGSRRSRAYAQKLVMNGAKTPPGVFRMIAMPIAPAPKLMRKAS